MHFCFHCGNIVTSPRKTCFIRTNVVYYRVRVFYTKGKFSRKGLSEMKKRVCVLLAVLLLCSTVAGMPFVPVSHANTPEIEIPTVPEETALPEKTPRPAVQQSHIQPKEVIIPTLPDEPDEPEEPEKKPAIPLVDDKAELPEQHVKLTVISCSLLVRPLLQDVEAGAPVAPVENTLPVPELISSPEQNEEATPSEKNEPLDLPPINLLDYASAVDELGNSVEVEVYDDGGFDMYTLGVYTITYRAIHPVTGEAFAKNCVLSVRTQKYIDAEIRVADRSSNARYVKFVAYRKRIQNDLTLQIDRMNEAFAERVAMIVGAFEGMEEIENIEYYRTTYADNDSDAGTGEKELVPMDEIVSRNWSHVLPVFVAMSSMKVREPLDLYNLRLVSLNNMDNVFFDMHTWNYHLEGNTLKLILTEMSSFDMADIYGMDERTRDKLDELMQPEFQQLFAAFTGDYAFSEMSAQSAAAIRETLPEGLSVAREAVVVTAHSLVGKVTYFWGGKHSQVGWDPMWGVPRIMESPASSSFGEIIPYGLDCSGYVAWVFVNAANDASVVDALGAGSTVQWNHSVPLGWDEALPGDLAFFYPPGRSGTNHVGVVVEKRADGSYLVAHCSSSRNAVVLTEAWETGFHYMRRPLLYNG